MTYRTVIEWWQTYYFHFNVCQNHVSFTRIWICSRYLSGFWRAPCLQMTLSNNNPVVFQFSRFYYIYHKNIFWMWPLRACASLWFTSKVNGIYYLLNAIHKTLLGLFDHYFVWNKPDFSTKTNFTELSDFKMKYHICLSRKYRHQ